MVHTSAMFLELKKFAYCGSSLTLTVNQGTTGLMPVRPHPLIAVWSLIDYDSHSSDYSRKPYVN